MEDVFTETYGYISREEVRAMRANAKTCLRCGMLATVDPVGHKSRYAHSPVIAGDRGELTWSSDTLSWTEATGQNV